MIILIIFNCLYNVKYDDFQGLYYKEPGYQNIFIESLKDDDENISCVLFDFPSEDNIKKIIQLNIKEEESSEESSDDPEEGSE